MRNFWTNPDRGAFYKITSQYFSNCQGQKTNKQIKNKNKKKTGKKSKEKTKNNVPD